MAAAKAQSATGGELRLGFPDGDRVPRSFNADGTSTAPRLDSVGVKNKKKQSVAGIAWQTINQPGGSAFLVSITLPTAATSAGNPYALTVTDSDGNSDTKAFNL